MKTNAAKTLLAFTAIGLVPGLVLANGFRNPPAGAAQQARSAARTTLADDATVVVHNPANMLDLPTREVLVAINIINSEVDYRGPMGSGTTEDPWGVIPSIFYTSPIKDGTMAWGIGLSSPYGQSKEWPKDKPFGPTSPYFAEMMMADLSPAFAAKVTEQVQVGVALDLVWSQLNFDQVYPWSQVTGDPRSPAGEASFETDGGGVGAHLGVTWQVTEAQRLGFTYNSSFTVDYEGDFKISNMPPLPPPMRPTSDAKTEITFPTILALGYGIDVNERLRLGAEVEWIEFSQYDQLVLDLGGNSALVPSTTLPQNWDDTWTFGFGGDYDLNETWVIRAGYIFLESPVPDESMAPTLPDADRHVLSIGGGWTRGGHTIDFAYSYSFYDDRDISNNVNPAYNGSYDLTAHLIAFSYAFDF